jgi:membrane protein implicated in regulation of membrane protease activity
VNAWLWWLVAAAFFGLAEVATTSLFFAMLAGGALAAAAAGAVGATAALQLAAFVVVSTALVGGVRPIAKGHLYRSLETRTGVDALPGAKALVTERVDGQGGRVKLAGEIWSARSYDGVSVFETG